MDEKAGGVAFRQWAALREHVDYVALGHFHKPFVLEDWIHNPGSPEACSISEAAWTPRGYLMVDVDTGRLFQNGKHHNAERGNPPRRCFRQYSFKTDHVTSPADLMTQLTAFVERKARDLAAELHAAGGLETTPPVIELYLTGVLPFDRRALDISAIEALVNTAFQPLVAQVKSLVQSADFAVDSSHSATRAELEQRVLTSLFARDVRFAEHSTQWMQAALALKQMALTGASPDAILAELDGHLRGLGAL